MKKASHERIEDLTQSEIFGKGVAVIFGLFALGFLVLISLTIFAVKLGENIMNYGS